MSSITPSLRLVVITLVVGCVVASLTGATAKERAPADTGLKIAVVNGARLILESKYYKTETDRLEKLRQDTQTVIRIWEQNSLLSKDEQKQLGELTLAEDTKAGLNATQKADKQKLLDKFKMLFNDFSAIQINQHPTQAENDRLREYSKAASETTQRENAEASRVKSYIDTTLAAVREKTDKDAKASLEKIAKKEGYNLVFSSEVVFYAENDITDKVLSDINH